MSLEPDRVWWTATEIADAALIDLPHSRQGVEAVATPADQPRLVVAPP